MTKIDKTDIDNIKVILNEVKIDNVSKFRIKKGEYEIETSSEHLLKSKDTKEISSQPVSKTSEDKVEVETINEENIVKSPMVGVAYLSADPDSPPYVKVGQHVKAVSYTHLTLPTTPYV